MATVLLAYVEIFLLSHHGFTDGFLLLVIPHNAWQNLSVGNYFLYICVHIYIYKYTCISREEQFSLEWTLYHIIWLALFLFPSPHLGKEVIHALRADPRCRMLQSPESFLDRGALWLPGAAAPSQPPHTLRSCSILCLCSQMFNSEKHLCAQDHKINPILTIRLDTRRWDSAKTGALQTGD